MTQRVQHLLEQDTARLGAEMRAWGHGVLADAHAAQGNLPAAVREADMAWQIDPGVVRQAALADLFVRNNQCQQAQKLVSSDTTVPALVLVRLRVLRCLGKLDEVAGQIDSLDAHFRHDIEEGDLRHAREMARFYIEILPRPALAERLARQNIEIQREPEDIWLLQQVTTG